MRDFLAQVRQTTLERVKQIPQRCFMDIFHQPFAMIAEIKFASPLSGRIYPGSLTPVEIAGRYIDNGASALSVLTEPTYFSGHVQYIQDIRQAYPTVFILLKDFVISKKQIQQALQVGADAVLLIAGFLEPSELIELYHYAELIGLTPIVEIHRVDDLHSIRPLTPQVLLINNRNLRTLQVEPSMSMSLIEQVAPNTHTILASGLQHHHDLQTAQQAGFDACLVGSHLMQHDDPGVALRNLCQGVKREN